MSSLAVTPVKDTDRLVAVLSDEGNDNFVLSGTKSTIYNLDSISSAALQTVLARGSFTLTPSATSTIVPVTGCLPTSQLAGVPWPQTLHAANALDTTSYTMGTGEIVVNHANNPLTDRTFGFVIFFF